MSKNIQVNLMVRANTTEAVNNINNLQHLLQQIQSNTVLGIESGSLHQASEAARQLQMHLQNAVNVNTGKLNLQQLNASLKASKTDLQTLTNQLQQAGTTGQQAFLRMATAIAQAEAPVVQINQKIKEFGTTLVNTVKWQIASTMIHGISGMLTAATGHAKDLNNALNEIRIVTGKSTQDMAYFADSAARAAKELSTTTTEYAKAALIFYQQGLEGTAVTERADVVIKLAQVTGQSAQTVSDQMTAIWNNFDDGSKSLEYYADVLAKLGADTAASTDEIAQGMEKFAAIGQTIGLSYEYAAASVATVVDKTRQSADVVGTSFKTIFARMQGLSLGETLEDGVDLNKYSQALADVGINVLNSTGEMRAMDDILDELGEKWQGFGETTQIALAQTVGGVRQYNQMIALMDNWDDVVTNIDKATDATGELTTQQQIWSESYEAAADRVKQSQNNLYEKFINDEAIVKLTDMLAGLIDGISGFIDAMGGIGPMALMLVAIFNKTLFPMVKAGFMALANNISVLSGQARLDMIAVQREATAQLDDIMQKGNFTKGERQQIEVTKKLIEAKKQLAISSKHMTLAQQQEAQAALDNYEILSNQVQKSLQRKAQLEQEIRLMEESMNTSKTKRVVAQKAATDRFRASEPNLVDDEVEDIITEATAPGASKTKTKKELASFDENGDGSNSAGKQKILDELDASIKERERRIEALEEKLKTLGPDASDDDRSKIMEQMDEEYDAMAELEASQKNINDLVDQRKKKLERILRIQEDISNETQKDIKDIAVGESSSDAFSDNFEGHGSEVNKFGQGMANKVATSLKGSSGGAGSVVGNTIADVDGAEETTVGAVVSDASMGNLEGLLTLLAEYKIQISEISALEQDFNGLEQISDVSDLIAAQEEEAAAAQEVEQAKEELKQVEASGNKNTEAAVKAREKLRAAEDKHEATINKLVKAESNYKKASAQTIKQLDALKKKMSDLAKQAGVSDDDLKDFYEAIENLKSGKNVAQSLDTVSNTLKNFKTATGAAETSVSDMVVGMRDMLVAGNFAEEEIDALIQRFIELGVITPNAVNQINGLNKAGEDLGGTDAPSKGDKLAGTISTIGKVAGTTAMVVSSLNGVLNTMFNPDASGMEKAMSVLMALATIIPTITTAIIFLTAVNKARQALQKKGLAITAANITAELTEAGAISAKTAATWGSVIANIAHLMSNPWTMGLAIAAVAGIAIIVASISIYTKATEANTEAMKEESKAQTEAAESANELSAKWAEQQDQMDELIKKYKDLKSAGEDYQETVDDIIDSVPDLVDAYTEAAKKLGIDISEGSKFYKAKEKIENAAAGGDINAVEDAQQEMDALISEEAAKAAKKGYDSSVKTLGYKLQDTQGSFDDNTYTVNVGGNRALFETVGDSEEDIAENILKDKMGTKYTSNPIWTDVGGSIELDMSTSDQFMEDYEALLAARDQMKSEMSGEDLEDSGIYEEVNELIEATKEEYTKAKEMQEEAKKYGVYDAKANLEAAGMDLTDISSLKEYQEYKDALLNDENVKGDPEAEAIALQWLEANASVQDYIQAERKIGYISDSFGEDAATEIQSLYDHLSKEEQELFLQVDFNKYHTAAAVESEIERLQGVADLHKIELEIEAINTAQGALKESGMTKEDWAKIQNSDIEWGQNGTMAFADFMQMSYEDQQDYLLQKENKKTDEALTKAQSTKTDLQHNLATLDPKSATYEEDKALIKEQLQQTENELAILQRTASDAKVENMGLNANEIQEYAQIFKESFDLEGEAAEEAAKELVRYNKAVDALSEGYEEWSKALKSNDIAAKAKAMKELDSVYADMLDLDLGSLSEEFLKQSKNLTLAERAAQGSQEAYDQLQIAAANDIFSNKIGTMSKEVESAINRVANIEGIDVGEKITVGQNKTADDLATIYDNIVMSALQGGKSVEKAKKLANEMMQSVGFETGEVEMEEKTVYIHGYLPPSQIPMEGEVYNADQINALGVTWSEEPGDEYSYPVTMLVPKGTSFEKTTENVGGKTKKSSGGGSKKKADKAKKSDIVERYKEVTDSLEDVQRAAEKTSEASDGLYGLARIKNMEKINSLLKDELALLGKKRKEALEYLKLDKEALQIAAKEAKVNLEFGPDGDIINYTQEMTKLYEELDAEITKANKNKKVSDKEQERIDAVQERIDKLKEAMNDYEATKEVLLDLDQEEIDKFNEQLQNNLDVIDAKVELEIGFNESDLEWIEYYLGKMESDVFSQAEAAALVVGKVYDGKSEGQLDQYLQSLQTYTDQYYALEEAYRSGKISSAQYAESMKELSSTMLSELGNIQEVDNAMKEYYGNTISMAQEELSKYTDRLAHATSVLDHYNSILTSLGKQNDYKLMGTVLNAQAEVAKNTYESSAAAFKMFRDQADARKAEYEAAKASNTASAYELSVLEEQWLAAETAAEEAQDQMLSDAATYAEQMRALLENSLGAYAQELEEALTLEFGSFANLSTEMERANSLQEEFLTTTNKIYETNKMMRNAQKEIDKTTNQMAKQKLKQFINETAALQQQGKLSRYELDVQQAKYDLLLAEIALKEAQNAKSTVRLQRDSEGNFGYVYTADQNAIADAQQKFDDAQNALYNKGLEGANDYTQKYQQTMSEMYDALGEIQQQYLDGEFASEVEYENAMKKAREYYYQKLQDYSMLYNVSLTTDSRVIADAWSTDFSDMTKSTETWMQEVDKYISNVTTSFSEYRDVMDQIQDSALGDIATEVSEIVTETHKITDALTGENGVVDALTSELNAVKAVTDAYLLQRDALQDVLDLTEQIAQQALNNARNTAYTEFDVAPGSQVTVNSSTSSWLTGEGKESLGSVQGGHGYTVIRWDENKENVLISDGAGNYGWVPISALVGYQGTESFDTGGYTGSWGSYGKMAMLHEKELVLNAQDTQNLLTSMEFLHHILQMIDLQSMSSQLGGILTSSNMMHNSASEIEQNVHIEASFPNVTSHSEIEEAFNNLINTSSQFAFKR